MEREWTCSLCESAVKQTRNGIDWQIAAILSNASAVWGSYAITCTPQKWRSRLWRLTSSRNILCVREQDSRPIVKYPLKVMAHNIIIIHDLIVAIFGAIIIVTPVSCFRTINYPQNYLQNSTQSKDGLQPFSTMERAIIYECLQGMGMFWEIYKRR